MHGSILLEVAPSCPCCAEPHSDEYYAFDLEECLRRAGLAGVVTTEADHRHRAVLSYLPK